MNILMMTNTYFPIVGGLEQSVFSFSETFRSLGHEVLIVTPAFGGMPSEEPGVIRIPAFQKFGGTIFSVNFPISGLLTRLMKKFVPDMVHSHSPFFMGDFALRLSRQHAIPLVFTYHTMFEQYIHDWPVQNEGIKRFMVKLAAGYANLVDQAIVPSESVKDILLKRGVKTPIEVIPTGVDLGRFSKGERIAFRKQHHIPPDALVIGHAGRLAPEKNLEFLTNCLVEVLRKDSRIHALIVGLGPSEKMIRDAFAQAGLEKRLHLTGVLHYQYLVDAYFAMDVFAFASLSETQGIVIIEAMAAGLPVVALDAPGAREVVEDHHNGRLLNEMDQQSFVDALTWVLYRSPEELQAIKQAARMTVQKYPIDSASKHMLEIYEKIRSKRSISLGKKNSSQYLILWRMRAEWDICMNYIKSVIHSVFKGSFQKTEPIKINNTTGSPPKAATLYSAQESDRNRSAMTEDGKRIAFYHIKGGFSKVIIIAHGSYNNKETFLFRRMAEAFSKDYDTIVFDFREHSKSNDIFTEVSYEQMDLRAVTSYAKDNHYVKIGVIGLSFGAVAALAEASFHQNIDSLIVVSAPADLGSISYHFWGKQAQEIRPLDIVDKISPTPILFLHGEKDWLIKPSHSQRLFEIAKDPKALAIIKDGGHAEKMYDVFPDQFMKICLDRFKETL